MLQTESLLNPFKTELEFGERTGAFFSGTRRARGERSRVQWRGQVAGLKVFFLGLKHWAVFEGLRQVSGLRYLNQLEQ